jgi:hypothetical protein
VSDIRASDIGSQKDHKLDTQAENHSLDVLRNLPFDVFWETLKIGYIGKGRMQHHVGFRIRMKT